MSDETDTRPCDCTHARDLHDDGLYNCKVENCDCLAFLPIEDLGVPDTSTEVEEEDVMEDYQQDPDWWKA